MSRILAGIGAAVAFAAALLLSPIAFADANSETVTAMTHAQLAADAPDLKGVHTHLHHALNCLAGPGGSGFDAKEMNPCAHSGHGAIPDTGNGAKKSSLESAAGKLRAGIAATDLKTAKQDASEAASMLKNAK